MLTRDMELIRQMSLEALGKQIDLRLATAEFNVTLKTEKDLSKAFKEQYKKNKSKGGLVYLPVIEMRRLRKLIEVNNRIKELSESKNEEKIGEVVDQSAEIARISQRAIQELQKFDEWNDKVLGEIKPFTVVEEKEKTVVALLEQEMNRLGETHGLIIFVDADGNLDVWQKSGKINSHLERVVSRIRDIHVLVSDLKRQSDHMMPEAELLAKLESLRKAMKSTGSGVLGGRASTAFIDEAIRAAGHFYNKRPVESHIRQHVLDGLVLERSKLFNDYHLSTEMNDELKTEIVGEDGKKSHSEAVTWINKISECIDAIKFNQAISREELLSHLNQLKKMYPAGKFGRLSVYADNIDKLIKNLSSLSEVKESSVAPSLQEGSDEEDSPPEPENHQKISFPASPIEIEELQPRDKKKTVLPIEEEPDDLSSAEVEDRLDKRIKDPITVSTREMLIIALQMGGDALLEGAGMQREDLHSFNLGSPEGKRKFALRNSMDAIDELVTRLRRYDDISEKELFLLLDELKEKIRSAAKEGNLDKKINKGIESIIQRVYQHIASEKEQKKENKAVSTPVIDDFREEKKQAKKEKSKDYSTMTVRELQAELERRFTVEYPPNTGIYIDDISYPNWRKSAGAKVLEVFVCEGVEADLAEDVNLVAANQLRSSLRAWDDWKKNTERSKEPVLTKKKGQVSVDEGRKQEIIKALLAEQERLRKNHNLGYVTIREGDDFDGDEIKMLARGPGNTKSDKTVETVIRRMMGIDDFICDLQANRNVSEESLRAGLTELKGKMHTTGIRQSTGAKNIDKIIKTLKPESRKSLSESKRPLLESKEVGELHQLQEELAANIEILRKQEGNSQEVRRLIALQEIVNQTDVENTGAVKFSTVALQQEMHGSDLSLQDVLSPESLSRRLSVSDVDSEADLEEQNREADFGNDGLDVEDMVSDKTRHSVYQILQAEKKRILNANGLEQEQESSKDPVIQWKAGIKKQDNRVLKAVSSSVAKIDDLLDKLSNEYGKEPSITTPELREDLVRLKIHMEHAMKPVHDAKFFKALRAKDKMENIDKAIQLVEGGKPASPKKGWSPFGRV